MGHDETVNACGHVVIWTSRFPYLYDLSPLHSVVCVPPVLHMLSFYIRFDPFVMVLGSPVLEQNTFELLYHSSLVILASHNSVPSQNARVGHFATCSD